MTKSWLEKVIKNQSHLFAGGGGEEHFSDKLQNPFLSLQSFLLQICKNRSFGCTWMLRIQNIKRDKFYIISTLAVNLKENQTRWDLHFILYKCIL